MTGLVKTELTVKSDQELAELSLQDQTAFSCLMERYQDKLFRYIRRISSFSPEEVEDILQEVFIKVYFNLNNFDPNLKLSSWLYRIAHNETISAFRKTKSRPQTITWEDSDNFINNIASDFDLNKTVDQAYLKRYIGETITKLDIKYREVLILKYFEGKDYKEMSDILKKPTGTIATLLNRAKKNFKKILAKEKID